MKFDDLPLDILYVVVEQLHSVHDYRSLLLASRAFHRAIPVPSSRVLAILASRPTSKGIQPFALNAIGLKGRVLADWAVQTTERRAILLNALKRGQQATVNLALSISPLTPADIVSIRDINKTVLLPMVRYLRALPDMATARATIGPTIIPNPFSSLQKVLAYCMTAYWAYCELFHHHLTYKLSLRSPTHPEPLDRETRREWISTFLYIEPQFKQRPGFTCLTAYERELAREVNQCRRAIHRSACLMLTLIVHRCVLVMADEISNRLEENPDLEKIEWEGLFYSSGALRILGMDTMKWLLASRGRRARRPWATVIVHTLVDAYKTESLLEEWTILEDDLQHRSEQLQQPDPAEEEGTSDPPYY